MTKLALAAAVMAALSFVPAIPSAHAETTLCTEIMALPFTITAQGSYCLKQNLNVNLASGNAITINAGNVSIDFNGFRINNQAPLATNEANGVYAVDRKHITLKNGFIRGFSLGIWLREFSGNASSGHLVELMKVADSGFAGIRVEGDRSVIRNNRVLATGGGPLGTAFGIVLNYADEGSISDNIVSGLPEAGTNYGVLVFNSDRVEVSGNNIRDVDGGTIKQAIAVQFTDNAIIVGNRLLNGPGTGSHGIFDLGDSENVACRDNEAAGFSATPFSGCDLNLGNVNFFH